MSYDVKFEKHWMTVCVISFPVPGLGANSELI